jgi:hypothetical protein
MCADAGEADQVRRLLAFLAPAMSLETQEDRLKTYQEAWTRLNPDAEKEVWKADLPVNFPWSSGKVKLWKTLRRKVETKFRTVLYKHLWGDYTDREVWESNVIPLPWDSEKVDLCRLSEHLNGEYTDRPIVDFSFMHYSEMLLSLLDIFLKGLDRYIGIQDHISAVSDNMDAYDEDERYMSEKSMRHSRLKRAQEFLDVILFMHAVPQRAEARWDALDHEHDVTWFREHCEVYQTNEDLMAFLRDCAVVVLTVGHFQVAPEVHSMHECYVELKEQTEFHKDPTRTAERGSRA